MKIALQYLSDAKGNPQAVQLPITDWEKVLMKLKKYEEALKFKSDLKEAFEQVDALKDAKSTRQTLKDFLNEL